MTVDLAIWMVTRTLTKSNLKCSGCRPDCSEVGRSNRDSKDRKTGEIMIVEMSQKRQKLITSRECETFQ